MYGDSEPGLEHDVIDGDGRQFRSAESTGVTYQYDGAIAETAKVWPDRTYDRLNIVADQSSALTLRDPKRTALALKHGTNDVVGRRLRQALGSVIHRDRGEATGDRRIAMATEAAISDVACDGVWGGWEALEAVTCAESTEVAPGRRIRALRCRCTSCFSRDPCGDAELLEAVVDP